MHLDGLRLRRGVPVAVRVGPCHHRVEIAEIRIQLKGGRTAVIGLELKDVVVTSFVNRAKNFERLCDRKDSEVGRCQRSVADQVPGTGEQASRLKMFNDIGKLRRPTTFGPSGSHETASVTCQRQAGK